MPSVLHEAIVSLFTERPQLAAELLEGSGQLALPVHDAISGGKVNLAQETTAAYDADEMTLLMLAGQVQMALIIEVQLHIDSGKQFSWPGYAASARFKRRCPSVVLVITPYSNVAQWARQTIDLGGGNTFTPTVFGPEEIPAINNLEWAQDNPEMAILSVIAHGRGPHAEAVAPAAALALQSLDSDKITLYTDLVLARLNAAGKEAFSHMFRDIDLSTYEWQSEEFRTLIAESRAKAMAEGEVKGEARGRLWGEVQGQLKAKRDDLTKLMTLKFGDVSESHRAHIEAADIDTLDRALERLLTAQTPAEVLSI
ncbi:MAG: hypothetical protein ACE366_24350 [Bradymonadia bacterium]